MILIKKIEKMSNLGQNKPLVFKFLRLKYNGIKRDNKAFVISIEKVIKKLK